jgi:LytS/YehU family sensor histidine kinase
MSMQPDNPNSFKAIMQELRTSAIALWWAFFDWVAVTSWRHMAVVFAASVVVSGIMRLHIEDFLVVAAIVAVTAKVLAGGKRRADLAASAATTRANVEALEKRLMEAQMAALQAQIEPHFLFNTLALIGQLIETDPPQAARIHTHLIQYLRSAMPQMREAGSGVLGLQVELSRAYLAIMQARMRDRLAVTVDLPEMLKQHPFPSMMLQTLVENSIKHGLEPKTSGGRIDIRARVLDGNLMVEVIDDGVGFDLHAGDGIGLSNIRERLKMLYGQKAQLVIEAPPQGGAYTCIRLPYLAAQAQS